MPVWPEKQYNSVLQTGLRIQEISFSNVEFWV